MAKIFFGVRFECQIFLGFLSSNKFPSLNNVYAQLHMALLPTTHAPARDRSEGKGDDECSCHGIDHHECGTCRELGAVYPDDAFIPV